MRVPPARRLLLLIACAATMTACQAGPPPALPTGQPAGVPTPIGRPAHTPTRAPALSTISASRGQAHLPPATAPARWDVPAASIRTPARQLAAAAPLTGPNRIVTVTDQHGHPAITVTTTRGRAAATAAIAAAQHTPDVLAVSVDARKHVTALPLSNDPYRWAQWGLNTLNAETIWTHQQASSVTVAVVDTGSDATHPDLAGSIVAGTDFVSPGNNGGFDGNGHGTHVAGIIGAVADNGIGVAGLAKGVHVLPVRVLDATGSGWDSDIARGVTYAVDHGAQVINLSLGGPDQTDTLATAIAYAISRNVVVTAAAGNDGQSGSPTMYPAAYPGVLAVAASDSTNQIADFSNRGSYVAVTAPGVDIASTYTGNSYVYMSGTSMASPFAAAAAALVKSANPALTAAQVDSLLEQTATPLNGPGRDPASGYGLINPLAAVCSIDVCTSSSGSTDPDSSSPTPSPASSAPAATSPASSTAPASSSPGSSTAPSSSDPTTTDPANSSPAPTDSAPATPSAPPANDTTPQPPPAATITRLLGEPQRLAYDTSISGTAQLLDPATGIGVWYQPLLICAETAPARNFTCTQRNTDSQGKVRYTFPGTANTQVYAVHVGTPTFGVSVSAAWQYLITPAARISVARSTLAAALLPATAMRVTLERWTGARWAYVATVTANRRGQLWIGRLPRAYYHLRLPGNALLTAAVSPYVLVP